MSLYPYYIEYARQKPTRRPLLDPPFGMGALPHDYLALLAMSAHSKDKAYRSWRNMNEPNQDIGSSIKQDKDKFQVNVDVQHFKLHEISVKTAEGYLVIAAKHDERADSHGFVSRNFARRYRLPESVNIDLIISKLSTDGVLTVTAPLNAPPKTSEERIVPIIKTGPVKKRRGVEETVN